MKTFLLLALGLLAIAHVTTSGDPAAAAAEEKLKKVAREIFDNFDADHNGEVNEAETEDLLRKWNEQADKKITDKEIKKIADDIVKDEDGDDDGKVTFDEFAAALTEWVKSQQQQQQQS